METARIQTVLRLPQELMERLRCNARKENISEDILSLGSIHLTRPTSEELEADPKLAYLWEKYGEL